MILAGRPDPLGSLWEIRHHLQIQLLFTGNGPEDSGIVRGYRHSEDEASLASKNG